MNSVVDRLSYFVMAGRSLYKRFSRGCNFVFAVGLRRWRLHRLARTSSQIGVARVERILFRFPVVGVKHILVDIALVVLRFADHVRHLPE